MTAAAADRITSGPVDPDLERVLPQLAMRARRLRQIESIMQLPEQAYAKLASIRLERGEVFGEFTAAAERLNIAGDRPGRALLLLVEEADRLYASSKRRPTLAQVLVALRPIGAAATRDLSTAESDLIEARVLEREARAHDAAASAAIQYLELCGQ